MISFTNNIGFEYKTMIYLNILLGGNKMFKARCPKCNNDVEVINGICDKCHFDINDYMIENGLIEGNQLITDKVFICPNCGDIEASTGRLYLKCSECGHSYKATDIDRKNPIKLIEAHSDEEMRQLVEEYVGDTINWDIYNAREEEWNQIEKERRKRQQQKQAEEQARFDAINHPKCPKCGSTAIQIIPRKFSFLTGFATNKVDRVCVNCKHKW